MSRRIEVFAGQRFGRWTLFNPVTMPPQPYRETMWLCKCDCGTLGVRSVRTLRYGKSNSCGCLHYEAMRSMSGANSPNWRGGRVLNDQGYAQIRAPRHPRATGSGYVLEHRLVMEASLGRYLLRGETVHHKNGDKQDNRLTNLELRVGNHGYGASVEERIEASRALLERYAPHMLSPTAFWASA